MFALCIESSHQKGMGHLYRCLSFIDSLNDNNETFIVVINSDSTACNILRSKNIMFETVDLSDYDSDWETNLCRKYNINIWVNDRLDTDARHAQNVIKNNIKLITFDDTGGGAELADLHVAALSYSTKGIPKGKKSLTGVEYLILNKEIIKYRKIRTKIENIIVTMGGSDTYGVTLKVIEILKGLHKRATIHLGPSFMHHQELEAIIDDSFSIIKHVPSLIATLSEFDLAVTGGGITPFEANAAGLPCIIIANETFEIQNGLFLDSLGSSVFAGYFIEINSDIFKSTLDIEKMSIAGINAITINGAKNVYRQILLL